MRLASFSRVLALFTLVGAVPGCADAFGDAIEDSLSCWMYCPLDSGPVEVEVETASGLDPALVRLGVFTAYPDEDPAIAEPGLDVLVSRNGKIKLDPSADGLRAFEFAPVLTDTIDNGLLHAEFPEVRDDGLYRVVVWYDSDGDGRLDLDLDGSSEFARAPARRFGDDAFDSYLFSLSPSGGSEGSQWVLTAEYCGDTGDGCGYGRNEVHPEHLDGWTVSIDDTTM